jgi:HEAT repeat protein
LSDSNRTNRSPAAADLIQALLEALALDDDEAAERAARACIGQAWLLPALRPLLADGDPDRRWWAVRVLALLDSPGVVPLMVERLHDSEEAVRCAAALGLGQLASEAAIPALVASLADASGWVRDSAGDALAQIGAPALPALVAAMQGPDGVRVRAAAALSRIVVAGLHNPTINRYPPRYGPALTVLFRALNDPNRLVRHSAHAALDRLGLLETVYFRP